MSDVLSLFYSLPFVAGGLAGILGMKLYQRLQCRYQDRHHPLPDGAKHPVPSINRMFWGGLLTVAILGYVLLQVGQTEQHYRDLGSEMRRCQVEFMSALKARADISAENDKLSREQREYLAQSDQAEALWIDRLINLPPEIAALPSSDDRVQQYGRTITRIYFERIGKINEKIADVSKRQVELEQWRRDNPLPSPSCGQ